ncbi:MAG: M48 family metallopeptidase [Candidatus Diapherotrites archaeon]|nr:M48 family metallopeptidase [Candidatus Diapherotrites archaeon]
MTANDNFPERNSIVIDSKPIQYIIRKSKRAKHLQLQINSNAMLEVVVPIRRNIPFPYIEKFLLEKKRWILRNVQKAEEIARKAREKSNYILFLGREVPIEIIESERKRATAKPGAGRLIVKVPIGRKDLAKRAIRAFYKKFARSILERLVREKASEMNLSFSRISVRSNKMQWGSCSPRKVLSFSWRLIAAPQAVVEYIVVHELAHIQHNNHSKAFWRTVQKYCPDYKKYERWLRKHGDLIKARTNFNG